ncbi:unnamed protein product [Amoebophrya sp. A25]|nr:unnamed protein product [Amoebophrya sp. A25]|eukprot:GSA25T00009524001.1
MLARFVNAGRRFVASNNGFRTSHSFEQKRTMVLGGGKPTSFRQDSLLVACTIAALTHYVPQDLVFLWGLFSYKRAETGLMGGKKKCSNPAKAFEEWKASRPTCAKSASMYGSGSCYYATI